MFKMTRLCERIGTPAHWLEAEKILEILGALEVLLRPDASLSRISALLDWMADPSWI
jgi:hypothetical protein